VRGKKRDRGGAGAAVVQAPILGLDRSRNHSYCHWGTASHVTGNRLLFSPFLFSPVFPSSLLSVRRVDVRTKAVGVKPRFVT